MSGSWILRWVAVMCTGVFAMDTSADTDQRIVNFSSEITIQSDRSFTVIETIRVRGFGGLRRELITRYRGENGEQYVTDIDVYDVRREGSPTRFSVKPRGSGIYYHGGEVSTELPSGDGIRVDAGAGSPLPEWGESTYQLRYRVKHGLAHFSDRDELFWNVTGNAYIVPIDKVSVTILLPSPEASVTLHAYVSAPQTQGTGNWTTTVVESGLSHLETTRPLQPGEGVTAVVKFTKGLVAAPPGGVVTVLPQQEAWLPRVAVGGMALIVAYYVLVWVLVGRDPSRGPLAPREEPPRDLSPAAMRFILRKRFDADTFATAITSMAQKGYLCIEEVDGLCSLVRKRTDTKGLAPEEKVIAENLFAAGRVVAIGTENHQRLDCARHACIDALRQNCEPIHFRSNRRYLVPAAFLSIGLVILVTYLGAHARGIVIYFSLWLSVWSIAVAFLLHNCAARWRGARSGRSRDIGAALMMTLLTGIFLCGEVTGIAGLTNFTSEWTVVTALVLAVAYAVFHRLLKAPTPVGRILLDEIEGFRLFLADNAGIRSPHNENAALLFEQYLPHAIALGEEKRWGRKFAQALEGARFRTGNVERYQPTWCRRNRKRGGPVGIATFLTGQFSNVLSAACVPPPRSKSNVGSGD